MDDAAAVVTGTRRQMRELVDGTLECKFHVDQECRETFLRVFSQIDTKVAFVLMQPEHVMGSGGKAGPAGEPDPASAVRTPWGPSR